MFSEPNDCQWQCKHRFGGKQGIRDRDIQPFDAGRHFERDQDVAVRLLVVDGAVEIEILGVKGGEAEEEKQKVTKLE